MIRTDEEWLEARLRAAARGIVLPPEDRWLRRRQARSSWAGIAVAIAVLVLGVALVATVLGIGEATRVASPATAQLVRVVPADWRVHLAHGLLLAAPAEWSAPESIGASLKPIGPDQYVVLRRPDHSIALTVSNWVSDSAADVIVQRFVNTLLHPTRIQPSPVAKGAQELVVDNLEWADPASARAGRYQARHIFIPAAQGVVVQLVVTGPFVEGTYGAVSASQIADQDRVAASLTIVSDVDRRFSRNEIVTAIARVAPLSAAGADSDNTSHFTSADGSRVHVFVYSDRTARMGADPHSGGRLPIARGDAPVAVRGLGNALVVVESKDADLTLKLLRALDGLVR